MRCGYHTVSESFRLVGWNNLLIRKTRVFNRCHVPGALTESGDTKRILRHSPYLKGVPYLMTCINKVQNYVISPQRIRGCPTQWWHNEKVVFSTQSAPHSHMWSLGSCLEELFRDYSKLSVVLSVSINQVCFLPLQLLHLCQGWVNWCSVKERDLPKVTRVGF